MKRHRILAIAFLLIAGSACVPIARAQSPSDNTPVVVKIRARATAPPVPAMKYSLMPTLIDESPGNAALLYFLATDIHNDRAIDDERIAEWLSLPIDQAMKDQSVPQMVNPNALKMLDQAARRDWCHFETTLRTDGFATLLPHLKPLRDLARMLAVQTRTQIAQGDIDGAIRTLQTAITLSRHLTIDAVAIQALVAAAIFNLTTDRIPELIQRPNAPNLYWALVSLPRPFIPLERMIQFERYSAQFSFPALKDLDNLSLEQATQIARVIPQIIGSGPPGMGNDQVFWTFLYMSAYPRGKE
jgi:hypothetical protein